MKNMLATTAIIALIGTPLFAENHGMAKEKGSYTTSEGVGVRVSDLMGKTVYVSREEEEQAEIATGLSEVPDNWDNVADINYILIGQDGEMDSIILDVGGFLGLGEKQVRIDLDNLMLIPNSDENDSYFAVYTGNRQLLEEAETYDEAASAEEGYRSASAETVDRSEMQTVLASEVTADELQGVAVYSSADKWIGEIDELVLTSDGEIEQMIVDVGGFLGLGEKEGALDFTQIELMRDIDGDAALTAYVSMTQEELEGMETWQGTGN